MPQANRAVPDYERMLGSFPRQRDQLLEILHRIQASHPHQYIEEAAVRAVARHLHISLAEVRGVISYYSLFSDRPRARCIIRVCISPVCRLAAGDQDILKRIEAQTGLRVGESDEEGLFSLETTACLGCCHQGPVFSVNHTVYPYEGEAALASVLDQIQRSLEEPRPCRP